MRHGSTPTAILKVSSPCPRNRLPMQRPESSPSLPDTVGVLQRQQPSCGAVHGHAEWRPQPVRLVWVLRVVGVAAMLGEGCGGSVDGPGKCGGMTDRRGRARRASNSPSPYCRGLMLRLLRLLQLLQLLLQGAQAPRHALQLSLQLVASL